MVGRNLPGEYDLPDECPECGEGYREVQYWPETETVEVERRTQPRTDREGNVIAEGGVEKTGETRQIVHDDQVDKFIFVHEMGAVSGKDMYGREQIADTIEEACRVDNEGQFDA